MYDCIGADIPFSGVRFRANVPYIGSTGFDFSVLWYMHWMGR